MSAERRHCGARIDDWLDGRLNEADRREMEEHFLSCGACRAERDGLTAFRGVLRAGLEDFAPEDLESRLAAWLDEEDARAEPPAPGVRPSRIAPAPNRRRWLRLAAAAAIGAVALASIFFALRQSERREGPVLAALRDFAVMTAADLPAAVAASDTAEIEARWRLAGIQFPVRVFDLAAMGIKVAGGDAPRLGGSRAARTIYRDAARWIVCWMFEERAARAWPPSAERRFHGGFEFEVHRQPGATLVLWREGGVVCMLVGGGDPEQVIALAQAKAMAPPQVNRALRTTS